tara:strand:- start:464 stop:625 length:162 start_codon:yes stop_codon:yes gene_type:complete
MFVERDEVTHEEYGTGKVTKIFPNGGDTIYGVDFGLEYNLFVSAKDLSTKEKV